MIVSGAGASFDVDAIVFDKDGTLIDLDTTWLGITEAWVEAAGGGNPSRIAMLQAALGVDRRGFLVPGGVAATGTFREIEYATRQALNEPSAEVDRCIEEARTMVASTIRDLPVAPIGDVEGSMRRLAAAGLVLCIASSDAEVTIQKHLGQLGVADLISDMIGGDGLVAPKPHPASLTYLSDRVGIPVGRMLMVGDSYTDLGAARNAGAAGILAVAPRNHSSPIGELCDGVIGSIQEIVVG